ncbi:N-acetylmuramoyl-L-alanine amidase [Sinorhizobium meliloti]|uniref:peptidoglycan recognition protein family protein n=1 Tax=Rhizobium meliloti TaxID=382 RepID=UPI003999635C
MFAAVPSEAPKVEARDGDPIPANWLPDARMKRIHIHWTAGGYDASELDREHYHVLWEGDGKPVRGKPSIKDNAHPVTRAYAPHTLNANSGAIGVSMCAMRGAIQQPFKAGPCPLTKDQWDACIRGVAQMCRRYGIPVTPETVLTHAEVQSNLGIKQRGKWDIAVLPFDPEFNTARACGDRLRSEVLALI